MNINYMDIAAAVILIICVVRGKKRGITYFAVSAIGKILSLVLSVTLYGSVSRYLRQSPLFSYISKQAGAFVNMEAITEAIGVDGLPERIMANDNSEIYKLFNAQTFEEYIAGYIANAAINIISVIAVYLCVSVVITSLFRTERILSKLPLIGALNGITGVLGGLIEGIIILWLLVLVLLFFTLQGKLLPVYNMLLTSEFAVYFFKYNIPAGVIFNIVP